MCGIAGLIVKQSDSLGSDLINMLKELVHRGRDATGVALYEIRDDVQARVTMLDPAYEKELLEIIQKYGQVANSNTYKGGGIFTFFEASIDMDPEQVVHLHRDIDASENLCVHSLGKQLKVYKDQGSAEDLAAAHPIKVGRCTHGIGHVRLATESVENINFAHPFVSYLYPEMSLVHNGQFTNYFNMRRKLENLGISFKTANDTEMAAHFIAYQMTEKGKDLEAALHAALDAFDGIFTIMVATGDQIGVFRDRLAFKPVVIYEDDEGTVLFGSEQISLTPIISDVYATEMEPGGVKVWSI
jgi:glutamine phosphoribosylpyrophosphate amidotransferase